MKPVSAMELCEAVRNGRALEAARLNRILRLDAIHGLLEVQAATPWLALSVPAATGLALLRKTATTMALTWLGLRVVVKPPTWVAP